MTDEMSRDQRIAELEAVVIGRVRHRYMGDCPDDLDGFHLRDPKCPACATLAPAGRPATSDGEDTTDVRDQVIDAIEGVFLPQLGSAAISHCSVEDVYAGLGAMREHFQTAEWKDGERR